MKMSDWTPQIIRFMEDASRYSDYFKTLASVIGGQVEARSSLSDMGCGLGQLSVELAPLVSRVDALDCSPKAIECLQRRVENQGHHNIYPLCIDMRKYSSGCLSDLMVFCLSASLDEASQIASEAKMKKWIAINKIREIKGSSGADECGPQRFLTDESIKENAASLCDHYHRQGIEAKFTELSLDFGQPFRNLKDAELYFRLFRNRDYPNGISYQELEQILSPGTQEEFSYYLPVNRRLAIFTFTAQ